MRYKYNYDGTAEGQATLVAEHSDKILVEIQDITEGHFLVFADEVEETPSTPSTEEQLAAIQEQNLTLMAALADMYDAIATITTTT